MISNNKNTDLDLTKLPRHIAFIMDGNGRWAKKRGLSRSAGHKAGSESLKTIIEECEKIGIEHVTVYAFSTENWVRPQKEVEGLMNLLRDYIQRYINESEKTNIRIDVIGDITKLDTDIQKNIAKLYDITKNKTGLKFHIAINYGGRDEIVRATKKMYIDLRAKKIDFENISQEIFEKYLDTSGIPDPELLIRTSGEMRTSNFLPWQLAYSEFCFPQRLWPDFTPEDLHIALRDFQNRERRFGGV